MQTMNDGSVKRVIRCATISVTVILGITLLIITLATLAPPQPVRADTLCVKPGGGDGCVDSISTALAAASAGDTIRVAGGTYIENVFISATVNLQGGWAPDFSIRDADTFSSTIKPADNKMSVVWIQGQFGDPEAVAPTLDGFVITGGRADLGSNHGGGLRIIDSNAIVISNTIKENVAFFLGGGVWVQRGAPTLQDNDIIDNETVGLGQQAYGGGVQLENTQASLMSNLIARNTISGTQGYGGGLEISGSGLGQVALMGNRFISNTVLLQPNGQLGDFGYGGAIAVSSGQMRLEDSVLISNTAATGGGIYLGGSPGACCGISGQSNLIQANSALMGGGFYVGVGGSISVTNSALIANQASLDGGAIFNTGVFSISNTTVSGNSAGGMGGGIANYSPAYLTNATVADNTSSNGAGVFNADTLSTLNSLYALNNGDNCLGVLNSLGNNLEDGGACALGQPSDMSNTAPSMDPLGEHGGGTPTHALAEGSPAIDAGNNAACAPRDQRGVMRPLDGDGDGTAVCDIGAYEYPASSTTTITSDSPDPSNPGDPFTVSFTVTTTVGTPSGTVTVTVGGDPAACSAALSGGNGSCALTISSAGAYTLTATYSSEDGSYLPSSDEAAHSVEISKRLYLPMILKEGTTTDKYR